jgi:hypothetical protein
MSRGTRCIAHRHEYATSEEHHHLQPQSRGGPTHADNLVWLCSNAHGDVHYFLDLIEDAATKLSTVFRDGPYAPADAVKAVPGAKAKHYSPAVRHAAVDGWNRYAVDFLAGKYDAHALLWSTSGQPREGLVNTMPYSVAVQHSYADHLVNNAWLHLTGHSMLAGPL